MDMYNPNNNGNCVGLHQQSTTSNNNICHQMQSTNKDVRDIPISNSPMQLITQQQRPPLNFVENPNTQQQSSHHSVSIIPKNTNIQRPSTSNNNNIIHHPSTTTISSNHQYNNDHHHQHHQQQHSSSNISTVSVIPSLISQQQTCNSQQGWSPYLVPLPGGSHISSTPDSGIQSLDSPPSVYTPPMVSPYSSQVRSCESISASLGGHGINLAFPIALTQNNCLETFLQINNTAALPPQLIGQQQQNISDEHNLNKQNEEEKELNESSTSSDFSDMPKLIPITNSQHDDSLDGEENNNNVAEVKSKDFEEEKPQQKPSTSTNKSTTKELLIHQGMTLQELAECISSSIPPEQLKQLTSLIQSKALGAKEIHIVEQEKEIEKVATKEKEEMIVECLQLSTIKNNKELKSKEVKKQKLNLTKKKKLRREEEESNKSLSKKFNNESPSSSTCSTLQQQQKKPLNNLPNNHQNLSTQQPPSCSTSSNYRSQVRLQLKQKLDKFIERVCNQLENTHLNIREEEEEKYFLNQKHPLQKLNWKLINERLNEKKEKKKRRVSTEENDFLLINLFLNNKLLIKNERNRKRRRKNEEDEGDERNFNIIKQHRI
ncbi:unnamed protein product [Meloidogyne enterolobii]|uniref:Uncharacterized protein n=1 Tax=Meloidogyne enterolobii TaxID=390850 RepID=A0ACB0ZNH0_MELEN